MLRTQMLLEAEQAQFLEDEAARLGVSMSELIRRWISERMEAAGQTPAATDAGDSLIGLARGGAGRVSERHDDELARIRTARLRPVAKAAKARA